MIEIKATPKFIRLSKKVMTAESLQALVDELSVNPEKGIIIKETGGIRKIRWATGKGGKGKRGGIRVLYYYDNALLILLITLYQKSDKEDIDAGEKAQMRKLVNELLGGKSHE